MGEMFWRETRETAPEKAGEQKNKAGCFLDIYLGDGK